MAPRGGGRPVGKEKMGCWVGNEPPWSPKHPPPRSFCATYGGNPLVSSASFWREPSLPARGEKKMWDLGQIKDKSGLVGWGWHGMGQGVSRGSVPIPPTPLCAPGTHTTHIVSVIVLVVGQLHHTVGALKGVQPWGPVRDNPKKYPTAPNQALGPPANPAGITEPAGSGMHHTACKASVQMSPFCGRERKVGY